ncbi:MAG: nucleoside monophosphate kinase, partial [Thermodesulfobacteria bacterium]|nr:nucleoside monophosphate kinase [Thermodesulfobacteriota bacterium]
TELGKKAEHYMKRGELVPDELILGLIEETLEAIKGGFILDGFPRTVSQAKSLDSLLESMGIALNGVVLLKVPDEAIVERLSARRVCPKCGAVYNMIFSPPAHNETCDRCGAHLVRREDDEPETIRNRLEVYHEQTAPLITYYGEKGLLIEVDGTGRLEEVTRRIEGALQKLAA